MLKEIKNDAVKYTVDEILVVLLDERGDLQEAGLTKNGQIEYVKRTLSITDDPEYSEFMRLTEKFNKLKYVWRYMKTQIIGSLILLLVLFGLFVASGGNTGISTSNEDAPAVYTPSSNDAAMKSLSIN